MGRGEQVRGRLGRKIRSNLFIFFFIFIFIQNVGKQMKMKMKRFLPLLLQLPMHLRVFLVFILLAAVSAPVGLRPRFIMLAFPLVIAFGTRLRGRPYTWAMVVSVAFLLVMTLTTLASSAVFP